MVGKTGVPRDSALFALQGDADYCDAFEVSVNDPERSALSWYLQFAASTPKWIDFLMAIRNAAVRVFSLKDVGKLADVPPPSAASHLRAGDRVGIFTIRTVCDRELILEITDTHLDVVLSVFTDRGVDSKIKVSTMVFYHNRLGRLYMTPVAPMHRIVMRSILSDRAAAAPKQFS